MNKRWVEWTTNRCVKNTRTQTDYIRNYTPNGVVVVVVVVVTAIATKFLVVNNWLYVILVPTVTNVILFLRNHIFFNKNFVFDFFIYYSPINREMKNIVNIIVVIIVIVIPQLWRGDVIHKNNKPVGCNYLPTLILISALFCRILTPN